MRIKNSCNDIMDKEIRKYKGIVRLKGVLQYPLQ